VRLGVERPNFTAHTTSLINQLSTGNTADTRPGRLYPNRRSRYSCPNVFAPPFPPNRPAPYNEARRQKPPSPLQRRRP
jgi:hypothetical protein